MDFFAKYGVTLAVIVPVIVIAVITAILLITKKRYPMIPTIEFYPPDKLNPAELGYIIDLKVDEHDVIALLYYWASHKHISLEEKEDGSFTITRLGKLDDDHTEYEKRFFSKLWTRSYIGLNSDLNDRGSKIPDSVNSAQLKKDFRYFAKEAFRKVDHEFKTYRPLTVKSRDVLSGALSHLVVAMAVLLPTLQLVDGIGFKGYLNAMCAALVGTVGTLAALRFPLLLILLTFVPGIVSVVASAPLVFLFCVFLSQVNHIMLNEAQLAGDMISIGSDYTGYYVSDLMYAFTESHTLNEYIANVKSGEIDLLALLLPALVGLLFSFVSRLFMRYDSNKRIAPEKASVYRVAGIAAGSVISVAYVLSHLGTSLSLWSVAVSGAFTVLLLFLLPHIRGYTEYGAYIIPRCEGFRQFLSVAEKDRLEMLLDENPNYYFDVLPYAHALRVSDIWKKKFDHLKVRF